MIKLVRYTHFTKAVLLSCFFMCACENDIRQVRALSAKKTSIERATDGATERTVAGGEHGDERTGERRPDDVHQLFAHGRLLQVIDD